MDAPTVWELWLYRVRNLFRPITAAKEYVGCGVGRDWPQSRTPYANGPHI